MSPLAVLNVLVRANTTQANAALATLDKQMAATGGRAMGMGGRITGALKNISLGAAGIGIGSIAMSAQFKQSMLMIETQAGASAGEVGRLDDKILALARSSQFSPNELAKGLFEVENNGFRGAKAMHVLKAAVDFAAVGNADLADTTYALSAAIDSGIKGTGNMAKATGTLNAIVGQGSMKMEDLNGALSTGILPSSRVFGVSMRQIGSALAVLTRVGMPAQMAATRLRMSLSLLAAPTDKASKELATIGLTQRDLAEKMRNDPRGLIAAIEMLHDHLQKLDPISQAQLLSRAFGGGRSSSAIIGLVQQVGQLGEIYNTVGQDASKFGQHVKDQAETPAAKFKTAISGMEAVLVRFGNQLSGPAADEIKKLTDALTDPKLESDERVSKAINILMEDITKAIGPATKIAMQVGGAILHGIFMGMVNGDELTRIMTVVGLVRLFGGKGAILAAGGGIGKWLGIGMAAEMTKTVAAAETIVAGGTAAAGAMGGGAAVARQAEVDAAMLAGGGMSAAQLTKLRGGAGAAEAIGAGGALAGNKFIGKMSAVLKNVRWARVAGIGIGLTLADGALNEFQRRAQVKSDDLVTALEGHKAGNNINVLGKDFDISGRDSLLNKVGLGSLNPLDTSGGTRGAAEGILKVMDQIKDANGAVTMEQVRQVQNYKEQADLTGTQRTQLAAMIKQMERAAKLKISFDTPIDAAQSIQENIDKLKSGYLSAVPDIQKAYREAMAGAGQITDPSQKRGVQADVSKATGQQLKRAINNGWVPATKANLAEVKRLFRDARLFSGKDPLKIARGFRNSWKDAGNITQDMIASEIKDLKKMPPAAQQQAAQAMLRYARQLKKSGALPKQAFLDLRSKLLSELNIAPQAGRKADGIVGAILGGFRSLPGSLSTIFGSIAGQVNQALSALGSGKQVSLGARIGNFLSNLTGGGKSPKGSQRGSIIKAFATGGAIAAMMVPGFGDGDKVPAMLEPGEVVWNKKAVAHYFGSAHQANKANKDVPRFQKGGISGGPIVTGIPGAPKDAGQAAVDRVSEAAVAMVKKEKQARAAAAAAQGKGKPGGGGLGNFDGMPVANWIIPILNAARGRGWPGHITSGYRDPNQVIHSSMVAPQGKSNHNTTAYPGGAIDVGSPSDQANGTLLHNYLAKVGAVGGRTLVWGGPVIGDWGHFSATGHQAGGIIKGMKGGGVVHVGNFNKAYPKAPGGSGIALPYHVVAAIAESQGLPGLTMAEVAKGEAALKPGNVSPDGGQGMWQMTPSQWPAIRAKIESFGSYYNPVANAKMSKFLISPAGGGSLSNNTWHAGAGAVGWNKHYAGKFDMGKGATKAMGKGAKAIHGAKAAAKVKKLGLSPKLQHAVDNLTSKADIYAEYADRASQLSGDVPNSALVHDQNELYWLNQELTALWRLRNKLLNAAAAVIEKRTALEGKLAKGQAALIGLKGIKKPSKAQKKQMAALTKSISKDKDQIGQINAKHQDLFGAITDVQGNGAPMKVMGSMPTEPGIFGGRIFDVQMQIKDLGGKSTATDGSAGLSAEQLKEIGYLSSLGVKFNPGQFAGFFAAGGYIPPGMFGVAGERGPEIVSGPAHVYPSGSVGGRSSITVTLKDERTIIEQDGQKVAEIVHDTLKKKDRKSKSKYRSGQRPD